MLPPPRYLANRPGAGVETPRPRRPHGLHPGNLTNLKLGEAGGLSTFPAYTVCEGILSLTPR